MLDRLLICPLRSTTPIWGIAHCYLPTTLPLTASRMHGRLAARAPGWTSLDQGLAHWVHRADLMKSFSLTDGRARRHARATYPNSTDLTCSWLSTRPTTWSRSPQLASFA